VGRENSTHALKFMLKFMLKFATMDWYAHVIRPHVHWVGWKNLLFKSLNFQLLFLLLQAQFDHVGTTDEYLHHLFLNKTLSESLSFQAETMVAENAVLECSSETAAKKAKRSFEDCITMHTVLRDRARYVGNTTGESVRWWCFSRPHTNGYDPPFLNSIDLSPQCLYIYLA
jgi:hypothetical protein